MKNLEEGEIEEEQHVTHKESLKAVEQSNHNKPTILFVSNIPEGCSRGDLLKTFEEYGEIFDIYVAKKKDKAGRNFGFVKYRYVQDVLFTEAILKKFTVHNRRLIVFKAKFDRFGNRSEAPTSQAQFSATRIRERRADPVAPILNQHHREGPNQSYLNTHIDVHPPSTKSVLIPSDTSAFSGKRNSTLIGRVKDFNSLCNIHSILKETNFLGMGIKYLGGFFILLTFSCSKEAGEFLDLKDQWNKWFSSLGRWIGQSMTYERIAWIKVLGVPPHLWDRSVVDSIGSLVGKVIKGSQIMWDDPNWSQEYIGVLVESGNQIRDEINIKWRDKIYKVWIIEESSEWLPDFLAKMKPDMSFKEATRPFAGELGVSAVVSPEAVTAAFVVTGETPLGTSEEKSNKNSSGAEMMVEVEDGERVVDKDGRKTQECSPENMTVDGARNPESPKSIQRSPLEGVHDMEKETLGEINETKNNNYNNNNNNNNNNKKVPEQTHAFEINVVKLGHEHEQAGIEEVGVGSFSKLSIFNKDNSNEGGVSQPLQLNENRGLGILSHYVECVSNINAGLEETTINGKYYYNNDKEGHHEPQGEGAGVSTPSKFSSYHCQGSKSDGQLVSTPASSPLPFSLSFAPKSQKKVRPKIDPLDLSLSLASEIYNMSNTGVPWDETIDTVEKENGKIQGRSRRVRKGVKVSRLKVMFPVEIIDRLT